MPLGRDDAGVVAKGRAFARQAEEVGDYGMAAYVLSGLRAQGHGDAAMLADEARLLRLAGREDEASALLGEKPKWDAQAVRLAANRRLASGDAAGALAMLDEDAVSRDALALNTRGAALDTLGRPEAAQAAYRAALALQPGDGTIAANLALSLTLADQAREAEKVVDAVGAERLLAEGRFWDLALVQLANGHRGAASKTLRGAGRGDATPVDIRRLQNILALPPVKRRGALSEAGL